MSIDVMTRVWRQAAADGSRLLVLLALADHANEMSVAWPKVETIAKAARVAERQARRIIDELEHFGLVFVVRGQGRGHSSMYCVLVGLPPATIPGHLAQCFPEQHEAIAAFCIEHEMEAPPPPPPPPPRPRRASKKVTETTPFNENLSSTTSITGEKVTETTPFPEGKEGQDVTLSEENLSSTTPFDGRKGDIAMSIDPSCSDQNLVVVVDQQQDESQSSESEHDPETNLVAYLKLKGMSAAEQFAEIPYAVGRSDFDAKRIAGMPIAHIVINWRADPPTAKEHHGHQRRPIDESRPAGQLSGSGQQSPTPPRSAPVRAAPTLRRATVASVTGKRDTPPDTPGSPHGNE